MILYLYYFLAIIIIDIIHYNKNTNFINLILIIREIVRKGFIFLRLGRPLGVIYETKIVKLQKSMDYIIELGFTAIFLSGS